jgi:hypothetical protein
MGRPILRQRVFSIQCHPWREGLRRGLYPSKNKRQNRLCGELAFSLEASDFAQIIYFQDTVGEIANGVVQACLCHGHPSPLKWCPLFWLMIQ